jgi:myo-inositol-1(or 4)-monophosphatase
VIYDPLRQELFTATRGAGAHLNDRRIRVASRRTLEGSLLGTGFPIRQQQHLDDYLGMFRVLFPQTAGVRRAGSAALDLAYVACGRLDGFWEIGLSIWDMAAGVLLIQEAGGLSGDLSGGHDYLKHGNIVSANPKLFPLILKAIRPYVTGTLAGDTGTD